MEARELRPGQTLQRGDLGWLVLDAEETVPRISAPFIRLRCQDQNGEVQNITIPSDEPVVVVD